MESENLEEAPWEIVDQILEILHNNWPTNVIAYNILKMHYLIKTKLLPDAKIFLLTPSGIPDKFATFVLISKMNETDMFFYSCHPDPRWMIKLLYECKHINWKESILFGPIPEKFTHELKKLISDMNMKILMSGTFNSFWCDPQAGKHLSHECPPEVYLAPVEEKHAELINSLWPHRSENSLPWVKLVIKLFGGFGLFLKDTHELVSWALHSFLCGPGFLQTVESHKRKGYASIIATAVTKAISEKNEYSVVAIVKENTNSLQLFSKLPYNRGSDVEWIKVSC